MAETVLNEEMFNLDTRKFLKTVGVTSQREIEQAVRAAMAAGRLRGDELLQVRMTLSIPALDLSYAVDGEIGLG